MSFRRIDARDPGREVKSQPAPFARSGAEIRCAAVVLGFLKSVSLQFGAEKATAS